MFTYSHSRLTTSPQADVARKVLAPCKTLHSKLWHAAGLIKTSFSKFVVQRNLPDSLNLVFWGLHGSSPEGLNSLRIHRSMANFSTILVASCCHLCSLSPGTSGIGVDPSNEDSLGAPFGSYPFFLHPTFPSSLHPGCVFFYPGSLFSGGHHVNAQPFSRNSGGQPFNLPPRSTCSRASSGTRAIGSSPHRRHCRSEGNGEFFAIIIWGGAINGGAPKKRTV